MSQSGTEATFFQSCMEPVNQTFTAAHGHSWKSNVHFFRDSQKVKYNSVLNICDKQIHVSGGAGLDTDGDLLVKISRICFGGFVVLFNCL